MNAPEDAMESWGLETHLSNKAIYLYHCPNSLSHVLPRMLPNKFVKVD